MQQLFTLLQKDIKLEIRQQYTFYGILLYVLCTIFIIHLQVDEPEEKVFNTLFWITQLFICVNAVAKSFLSESKGRMLYYYSHTSPQIFVASKLIFNVLLMLVMSLISCFAFTVLLSTQPANYFTFILLSLFGGISLSMVFSFLSAIAAKAHQQTALITILGFPIIIPQLLLLSKISTIAFANVVQSGLWQMIGLLTLLDVMVVALAIILFPFLWKD